MTNTTIVGLLVALVLSAQQPMTQSEIKRALTERAELLLELILQLPTEPIVTTVSSAAQLHTALAAGGVIELQAGATFTGPRFVITKSGTVIRGHGATLHGTDGPGLYIPPDVDDVRVEDISATSAWQGAVIQCGDNGPTQTARDQVPQRIAFTNVTIPTHRGKRGLEINCSATIVNAHIADVYSGAPNPPDSQAIAILNTCGPVSVLGGALSAGSEIVLVGGDTLKITDCPEGVAADLLFDDVTMARPVTWQTDGIRRSPKNVFELKASKRVTVRKSRLVGSWRSTLGGGDSTQDGSCIVITPKNGQYIADVIFEDNVIERCGAGVQLMGLDYNSVTPHATTGIAFRRNRWAIDGPAYGGRGILALVVGSMGAVTFEDETVVHTGTALFLVDSPTPTGPFTIRGSRMTTGRLAVAAPGVNYGGQAPAAYAGRQFTLIAEGNTFADAPRQFKALYPGNTFVTRAELDAMK